MTIPPPGDDEVLFPLPRAIAARLTVFRQTPGFVGRVTLNFNATQDGSNIVSWDIQEHGERTQRRKGLTPPGSSA